MKEKYTAHYAGEQDGWHVWHIKGPGINRLISDPWSTMAKLRALNLAADLNIAYAAGAEQKK